MDKNISSNSKKFLILLLVICLVFFVAVIKAFEYLPTSDKEVLKRASIDEINKPAQETSDKENEVQKDEDNVGEETKSDAKTILVDDSKPAEAKSVEEGIEPLENIDSEDNSVASKSEETSKPVELTPQEKADKIFATAQKFRDDKQYVKALEEYQKIPSVTSNTKTIARSYEEIATIYAIVKRYGTALAYAQKAYNTSPSSSREMLLARLYYKTGDIEKATRRVNNVLQRDFSADR